MTRAIAIFLALITALTLLTVEAMDRVSSGFARASILVLALVLTAIGTLVFKRIVARNERS
jgi:hypothetical protein